MDIALTVGMVLADLNSRDHPLMLPRALGDNDDALPSAVAHDDGMEWNGISRESQNMMRQTQQATAGNNVA